MESLTESEFENLCAEILEKLGYGPRQHPQNYKDSGEDLRMGLEGRTMVVECRHCPGKTIGRPTVQQLHSAAIASGAKTAMVITTGKFAKTALDYAKDVSCSTLTVELVDLSILRDMAARANVASSAATDNEAVWMHKVFDDEEFAQEFGEFLNRRYESHPRSPSQMLTILTRKVQLYPSYEVQFSLDAAFKTTIGVIHRESESNSILLLSGVEGKAIRGEVADFYRQFIPVHYSSETPENGNRTVIPFTLADMAARQVALREILRSHTRRVSYLGRNGRVYEKLCEPKEKDVIITRMRRVYLPGSTTTFRIGEKEHTETHLDNPAGDFRLLNDTDILTCSWCGNLVKDEIPQLCNACGAITHPKRLLSSHGVACKDCGMTLCRNCAVFIRRFIIKSPFCKECAEKRANRKVTKGTSQEGRSTTKTRTVRKIRRVRPLNKTSG